jgi:hypothetical protein
LIGKSGNFIKVFFTGKVLGGLVFRFYPHLLFIFVG